MVTKLRGDQGHFAGKGLVWQGIEDDIGSVADLDVAEVKRVHVDIQFGLAEVGDGHDRRCPS